MGWGEVRKHGHRWLRTLIMATCKKWKTTVQQYDNSGWKQSAWWQQWADGLCQQSTCHLCMHSRGRGRVERGGHASKSTAKLCILDRSIQFGRHVCGISIISVNRITGSTCGHWIIAAKSCFTSVLYAQTAFIRTARYPLKYVRFVKHADYWIIVYRK